MFSDREWKLYRTSSANFLFKLRKPCQCGQRVVKWSTRPLLLFLLSSFPPRNIPCKNPDNQIRGFALESSLITTVKSNRNFLVNGAQFPSLLVRTLPWASAVNGWTTTVISLRLVLKQAVDMQRWAANSQTVLCDGKDLNVMTTTKEVVNSAIPD